MFLDIFSSIKNVKFKKNGGFNHAVVNGTGHVYGFKYYCHTDTAILTKALSVIFSDSGLDEMTIFVVRSQTPSSDQGNSVMGVNSSVSGELSSVIVGNINKHLQSKSYPSSYFCESIFVCSNQELSSDLFSNVISELSNKGLILTGLNQDELIKQLETWICDSNSKFTPKKGSFGEVAFSGKKAKFTISAPLIEIKEPPTTTLPIDLDTSSLSYKLITACYFMRIDDEVFTRYFHGIRLFSKLNTGIEFDSDGEVDSESDAYKNINDFLHKLTVLKIKYSIPDDSQFKYLAMIPGVFHIDNYFIKSSIKKLTEKIFPELMFCQNDYNSSLASLVVEPESGTSYPMESSNHELRNINILDKNVALSGVRDDFYKSFIAQHISICLENEYKVVLIDSTDELNYFPYLFGGQKVTSPDLYRESVVSSLLELECSPDISSELLEEYAISTDGMAGTYKPNSDADQFNSCVTLLRSNNIRDYIKFMVALLSISKNSKLIIILNNADDISHGEFFSYFLKAVKLNGSSCMTCLGSAHLFEDNQKDALYEYDVVVSRKESLVKSRYKPFEVHNIANLDSEDDAWFGFLTKHSSNIVSFPTIKNHSCLFNKSMQNEHMVERMHSSGSKPISIFQKLSMLD